MKRIIISAAMSMAFACVMAGGYLTNTNLSSTFQRNPAREGAIAIDGVYSNPAGVTFLEHGLHIQVNWQSAFQHRNIDTEYAPFAKNIENPTTTRSIEGEAIAPVIPSILASYNHERWNIQVMAGLVGGGGKCVFENGLSSLEQAGSMICSMGEKLGVTGYGMNSYLRGKQFYIGYQLGAGYKITDNFSVYGGVRATQAICQYYGTVNDIKIQMGGQVLPAQATFESLLGEYTSKYNAGIGQVQALMGEGTPFETAEAFVLANAANEAHPMQATFAQLAQAKGALPMLQTAVNMTGDISLNCDQKGLGWAPVIGFDYILNDKFNFGVKYEFRTKMTLHNRSANEGGEGIEHLKQFENHGKVREDIPAIAAAGVQYSPISKLRIDAAYHQYFDKDAHKFMGKQKMLDGNTWEVLFGVEYDITDKLTVSCGGQSTNYPNTDEYMSDMSFVTNSFSAGLGIAYKFSQHWTLDAAVFRTFYSDYSATIDGKKDTYTRDNQDFGLGLTLNF